MEPMLITFILGIVLGILICAAFAPVNKVAARIVTFLKGLIGIKAATPSDAPVQNGPSGQ